MKRTSAWLTGIWLLPVMVLGGESMPRWFEATLPRIVQTLWREPDAAEIDAGALVRHLRAVRANCVVVNGGGVVDFFRHEHEMANPTPELPAERDVLREVVEACRREGIRVLARVDFRGVEEARFRRRPEWFARAGDGRPLVRDSGLFQSCFNGGYRNDYGVWLIGRLLDDYGVDGIWYNAVQSPGACYCAECERKFRAATGEAIPRGGDEEDAFLGPKFARYRELKAGWALEHLTRVRAAIKAQGVERVLSVETFGMYAARPPAWGGVDVVTVAPVVDFMLGKAFVDDGEDAAVAGSTLRFLRAVDATKPVVLLTSTHRNKFRLLSEEPEAVRGAWWEAVAAGGGIWNALVAGADPASFADRRAERQGAPAFEVLERLGRELARQRPVVEAAIYFSTATRARFPEAFAAAMQGAERVLAEQHVPYGYLLDTNSDAAAWRAVKVLVLPAATVMAEEEAARIREYVRAGGTLVADFQASLLAPDGTRRKDFALADVIGVTFAGRTIDQTRNSPHRVRQRHPLFAGWEETELLLNGGRMALCRPGGAAVLATRIPPPPGAVPEQSWLREDTQDPTIVVNEFGAGRAVYFAHEIMRQALADRHPDFGGLVSRAVELGRGRTAVLRTNAPRSVRISLLADGAGGYTLACVNHGPAPAHDVRVALQLPGTLRDARAMTAAGGAAAATEDGAVVVRFAPIADFAGVALTLDDSARAK